MRKLVHVPTDTISCALFLHYFYFHFFSYEYIMFYLLFSCFLFSSTINFFCFYSHNFSHFFYLLTIFFIYLFVFYLVLFFLTFISSISFFFPYSSVQSLVHFSVRFCLPLQFHQFTSFFNFFLCLYFSMLFPPFLFSLQLP